MLETDESTDSTLIKQFRRVLKDGIDYLSSALALLQARAAEMALSSLLFAALLLFAAILGMAALVLAIVALGFWLTHVTGNVGWSLLIIGGILASIAAASVWRALRWLNQLKS